MKSGRGSVGMWREELEIAWIAGKGGKSERAHTPFGSEYPMKPIYPQETEKATLSVASMLEFLFHRVRGRASGSCYEEWPAKHCLEAWM